MGKKDKKLIIENLKNEISRTIDLDSKFKYFEEQAAKILKREGYPTTFRELEKIIIEESQKELGSKLPMQIKDIHDLLLRIMLVRKYIDEKDAKSAAWNAFFAANAVVKLKLAPFEPHINRGLDVLEGSKKSGKARAEQIREERQPVWDRWKQEADDIWEKHPSYSVSRVAKLIDEDKWETVRRRIK